MSEYISLLITIYYKASKTLVRCGLKIKRDRLTEDCIDYPLEPKNREIIHGFLPLHVRSVGEIVEVEKIFEIENELENEN